MPASLESAPVTLSWIGVSTAALHDVSFTLHRGEVLSLLGAPGKSGSESGVGAVLEVVAGFVRAGTGQVRIAGRLVDATPTHRRGIGMVDRALSLFPHLDVLGHAQFAPGVRAAQADAMLRLLELQGFARRQPLGLSAETRLRVALARALAPGPRVLLLEDPPGTPLAGLKSILRRICAETGLSILHATADIAATHGFADRIGVMQAGRLRQLATPQALYERPESLAAAQASGPLNRLAGTVLDSEDDIARIRLAGGTVVEARLAEPIADGGACVVALRPERIAVAAVRASDMGDGAVPAHLIETVQEGAISRIRFGLDGNTGAEVVVTRPSGVPLPRGNTMCLAWQPHHAHAFPTEAA